MIASKQTLRRVLPFNVKAHLTQLELLNTPAEIKVYHIVRERKPWTLAVTSKRGEILCQWLQKRKHSIFLKDIRALWLFEWLKERNFQKKDILFTRILLTLRNYLFSWPILEYVIPESKKHRNLKRFGYEFSGFISSILTDYSYANGNKFKNRSTYHYYRSHSFHDIGHLFQYFIKNNIVLTLDKPELIIRHCCNYLKLKNQLKLKGMPRVGAILLLKMLKHAGFNTPKEVDKMSTNRWSRKQNYSEEVHGMVGGFLDWMSKGKPILVKGLGYIGNPEGETPWSLSYQKSNEDYLYAVFETACERLGYCNEKKFLFRIKDIEQCDTDNTKRKLRRQTSLAARKFFGYAVERLPKSNRKKFINIIVSYPRGTFYKKVTRNIFLTPLDLVRLEKIASLVTTRIHPARIKALMAIAGPCRLRRCEIVAIKIKDFERDPLTGLLKRYKGGGFLHLPSKESKGDYSPSHPEYGIRITPSAADAVDGYLIILMEQGAPDGAYFFHKGKHWSCGRAGECSVSSFFDNHMDSLKEALVHNPNVWINARLLRRSFNNILKKVCTDWADKDRIAEIQMRHDIFKTRSSTNNQHYTDDPDFEDFVDAVDYADSFPRDEEKCKEWMKREGYDLATGKFSTANKKSMSRQIAGSAQASPNAVPQWVSELIKNQAALRSRSKIVESEAVKGIISKNLASQKLASIDDEINSIQQKLLNGPQ